MQYILCLWMTTLHEGSTTTCATIVNSYVLGNCSAGVSICTRMDYPERIWGTSLGSNASQDDYVMEGHHYHSLNVVFDEE
ncbi:hypothetical protein Hypma_008128 [Hypsizygus marmoreus]|uniref:Secreted protein n=1 Tax=Hypsizygus marmoreus TaxID=39966 RepID=A0A369JV22_HYPMA|nr:hypothetical protein Hypma_008128 [Hypsizygus marmoreus]